MLPVRLVVAVLAVGLTTPLLASDPEQVIGYRKSIMRAIGGHTGALKSIEKGRVDFTASRAHHARAMVELTGELDQIFPEGSDFGETDALEAIWAKPDAFAKVVKQSQDAALAYERALAGGDTAKAFNDLESTCKDCHKDFRKKTER
ncbi:MAG: cytochrome c [Chromatiales bacterium]|nr:cytochrome c [Chromatiales bacterium]